MGVIIRSLVLILTAQTLFFVPAALAKVHIRYMTWTSSDSETDTLRKVISAFEARYPDTKVEVVYAAQGGYFQRYLQLSADGKAPDVVEIDSQDAWRLVDNRLVEDLNRYLGDGRKVTDNMVKEYINTFIFKGTLSALPLRYSVGAMAYNSTLFQEAGLPTPGQFTKGNLWTWTSFLSMAKKLTRHKNGDAISKSDLWGYAEYSNWSWDYWVYGSGGALFNSDYTRCTLDTPESIDGLQFQSDLAFKYKVTPPAGNFVDDFAAGKIGMVLGTAAMYPKWKAAGSTLKWGLSQFPAPENHKPYVRLSSQGVAISRQSHRKLYAWDFVRFLTSVEGQKILIASNSWTVPANLQAARSDAFLGPKGSDIHETLITQSLKVDSKRNPFNAPIPDTLYQRLSLELAQYWAVRETTDSAAVRINTVLTKMLDDWNKKKNRKRFVNP